MRLSQKQKVFSEFPVAFLKSTLDFHHFLKKMTLLAFVFQNSRAPKTLFDKCLKRPVSEDSSASKTVDVPKHC